ncbi:MAG: VWA domain-containing protein [Acidobacteriota bacterium]|nr:VWA domain-containing protein [Acidobacteriota bacterium]
MRRSGLLRCSVALGCLALAAVVPAQTPPSPAARLSLQVTVTDANGALVSGLNPQDFTILDNGQPQRLVSYAAYDAANKPETPVQILLLLDALNLDAIELGRVRRAAERYLRQNEGQLAHPTSLVILNDRGTVVPSAPTTDGNALAPLVDQARSALNLAPLDRYLRSLAALSNLAQQEKHLPGRKLLIWLGPGWIAFPPALGDSVNVSPFSQTSEFNDIATLLNGLREAQITLYGGFLFAPAFRSDRTQPAQSPGQVNSADLRLSTLAFESGGRTVLGVSNRTIKTEDQIDDYLKDADVFYSLAFVAHPSSPRLPFHSLQVRIDKPGLTAHTSIAYYDVPHVAPAAPGSRPLAPAAGALPAGDTPRPPPLEAVTVAALESRMRGAHHKADNRVAVDLSSLVLTQRLGSALFTSLQSSMPGPESRQALVALADRAVFLDLPPAETPSAEAPSPDEQQRIWSLVVEYVLHKVTRLPNFFATQTNTEYKSQLVQTSFLGIKHTEGPIWFAFATSASTIYFRDGKEVLHPESTADQAAIKKNGSIQASGTFGPVLSTVVGDAARNNVFWSHWESGPAGRVAVFRFVVPKEQSHYHVDFKSLTDKREISVFSQSTAYHGTIAVDPLKGTILRIALQADIDPGLPIQQSDLMVEYGTVQIGERPYTCPLKAVAISTGRSVTDDPLSLTLTYGPTEQIVDDIAFTRYHVFRSDATILF